jgi:hypothetical protein
LFSFLTLSSHHLLFCFVLPEQLITNCFWDVAKNGSSEDAKGRWLKYTPRFVCHYVMDHLLSVRYSNPDADEDSLFTIDNFKKVLGKMSHTHRRLDEDHSTPIVWRSSPRDLFSWDRMGPMLVVIPNTNLGPQVQQEADAELYPLQRSNSSKLKDLFFRQISCTHEVNFAQLNHIVIARLLLFKLRHPTGNTVVTASTKKPIDASHLETVFLGDGLKFTRFFDNPASATMQIQTVWKHYKKRTTKWEQIRQAAMYNSASWCSHGEHQIDVLQCTAAQEAQMVNCLHMQDSYFPIKQAERGCITRKFLLWLLEQKEWYNGLRSAGTLPSQPELRNHVGIVHARSL